MYKKILAQIVAPILTVVMERKILQKAYNLSHNQKGVILQYFICNKSATRARKMAFSCAANRAQRQEKIKKIYERLEDQNKIWAPPRRQ